MKILRVDNNIRVDKSTVSWGKLKVAVEKYEKSIHSAQIVKLLKIAYFREKLENVNFMLIFNQLVCCFGNSALVSNRRN